MGIADQEVVDHEVLGRVPLDGQAKIQVDSQAE